MKCRCCNKEFKSKYSLQEHINRMRWKKDPKHIVGKYICSICNIGFDSRKSLNSHISQQKDNKHQKYYQNEINKVLRGEYSEFERTWESKILKHHLGNTKCPICSELYRDNSGLTNHISNVRDEQHKEFVQKHITAIKEGFTKRITARDILRQNDWFVFSASWIGKNLRKIYGEERYKRYKSESISKIHPKGPNHKWYKHGRSYDQYRGPDFPEACRQVWIRDKGICTECGFKKKTRRVVHHIIPYRVNQDNSLENLRLVCLLCHKILDYQTEIDYPLDKYPPTYVDERKRKEVNFTVEPQKWTEERDKIIRENYLLKSDEEIAKILDTTKASIETRRLKLGLKKMKKANKFSKEDDSFIKNNYIQMSAKELGEKLNRSEGSISQRIRRLGLNKFEARRKAC